MTYCLALKLRTGLVFASDSRTTAGVDYISTYRKMHVFRPTEDRMLVLLASGNLATTQEVLDNLRRDLAADDSRENLRTCRYFFEAAHYIGSVLRKIVAYHAEALKQGGADSRASLIVGGQILGQAPELYLVYPEGNYVAATEETPFLQLGEFKYDGARLALISFDAAMKSNLSVGPPVELAIYPRDTLAFSQHVTLEEESSALRGVCSAWNSELKAAFGKLPKFDWE